MKPTEVTDWDRQWKEVRFTDTVKVYGISRGRSAANFQAYSKETNSIYTIFISDFLEMSLNGDVVNSEISGEFKVMKKGCNLGIRLISTPKRESFTPYNRENERPSSPIPYCIIRQLLFTLK